VPLTYAVVGAGGAGFRTAAAQAADTPDAILGQRDVRLYGIYDPATDAFTHVGDMPDGTMTSAPWMRLLPSP
jgi:hypothetical protein